MTTQTKDPYVAFLESELKKKSSIPKKKKVKAKKKRKNRKKVVSKSKQKKTNFSKSFGDFLTPKGEGSFTKFVSDLREERAKNKQARLQKKIDRIKFKTASSEKEAKLKKELEDLKKLEKKLSKKEKFELLREKVKARTKRRNFASKVKGFFK